jgi:AAA15 family ATPase/GTPase
MPTTTVEKTKKKETDKDEKSGLHLDSLEIKGYRCFEHLKIEKLGRVNLIVGKNNVGKTALLEALWIYAEASNWNKVITLLNIILEKRYEKEIPKRTSILSSKTIQMISLDENVGLHFRHLFNKRPSFDKEFKEYKARFLIDSGRILPNDSKIRLDQKDCLEIDCEYRNESCIVTSPNLNRQNFHQQIRNLFVGSSGLSITMLTEIWDDVILRNEEDAAINALKIISKNIIDLNFINYPRRSQQRVPVVRTEDINERVPLNSLGEGMNRLLGIALALVNCKDGILLIDEIESGLHYSVLPDVWKLIFKTARDLNVQVFATTHSFDCIVAFTQAAIDDKESDGMLIRLENKNGAIKAVTFSENELETVTRRKIEVR